MKTRKEFMREVVRPIAIAFVAITLGSLLAMVLREFFDIKVPSLARTIMNFAFASLAAFFIFPSILKQPFGDVSLSEYLKRLGFYWPKNGWWHLILGVLLAACTLLGMLIGSLLTGRYVLDWSTVNLSHTLFSINPGLWEEFFYRGIIMFVLLKATKSCSLASPTSRGSTSGPGSMYCRS